MKPVFQEVFCSENGDCFRACVASILELKLEEVPMFKGGCQRQYSDWLNKYYGIIVRTFSVEDEDFHETAPWFYDEVGYQILTVKSQRFLGVHHAVVGQGLRIIHDPSNMPIETYERPIHITLFIHTDLSKLTRLVND